LHCGKHAQLIVTDNRSFQAPPRDTSAFGVQGHRYFQPEDAFEAIDSGRAYNGGHPPQTIRFNNQDVPNPSVNEPPTSTLGAAQKAWLIEQMRAARTTWKIWGHSFGTLQWRADLQNLPAGVGLAWPSASYGLMNDGFRAELSDILTSCVKKASPTSKELPPGRFDPVGVEFVTGSISAPGLFEGMSHNIARDDPLRPLYLHDLPDGRVQPAINMTVLHGVQASLTLQRTGDVAAARAARNANVAPHLAFADLGGHGYTTIRVNGEEMETEFVCIPRPVQRIDAPDGGPLTYRVVHRVRKWARGEHPELRQEVVEGEPLLAI
jgi:alkaline phosphatase D